MNLWGKSCVARLHAEERCAPYEALPIPANADSSDEEREVQLIVVAVGVEKLPIGIILSVFSDVGLRRYAID